MPRHLITPSAVRHLTRADRTLAALIRKVGPYRLTARADGTHFAYILRAITSQQLSGKAAHTIHTRVLHHFGGPPEPAAFLATADEPLRACGLSRQKIGYLRDLAARVQARDVPFDTLASLPDDDVIAALTRVKGVGVWTAHMFLMFRLGRPDILPTGDLGIQNAIQRAYRLRRRPRPAQMERIAAPWRPHATAACLYLWKSLEAV